LYCCAAIVVDDWLASWCVREVEEEGERGNYERHFQLNWQCADKSTEHFLIADSTVARDIFSTSKWPQFVFTIKP
jgi:hypothetical protein